LSLASYVTDWGDLEIKVDAIRMATGVAKAEAANTDTFCFLLY